MAESLLAWRFTIFLTVQSICGFAAKSTSDYSAFETDRLGIDTEHSTKDLYTAPGHSTLHVKAQSARIVVTGRDLLTRRLVRAEETESAWRNQTIGALADSPVDRRRLLSFVLSIPTRCSLCTLIWPRGNVTLVSTHSCSPIQIV
jgi:hypothetical protein